MNSISVSIWLILFKLTTTCGVKTKNNKMWYCSCCWERKTEKKDNPESNTCGKGKAKKNHFWMVKKVAQAENTYHNTSWQLAKFQRGYPDHTRWQRLQGKTESGALPCTLHRAEPGLRTGRINHALAPGAERVRIRYKRLVSTFNKSWVKTFANFKGWKNMGNLTI